MPYKSKWAQIISTEGPFFIGVPAFLWQILFFYIPLFFIIILSILQFSDSGALIGFTLEYFKPFIAWSYFLIICKSTLLALINSVICFLIGFPVAYFLSFAAGRLKNVFLFLLILPFWTNFLLHIYAWFFVLERGGFINNFLMSLSIIKEPFHLIHTMPVVIMVMVYCYLPFMVLPIYSILERLDHRLIEASYDLGAGRLQTWTKILLPLSMSGVKTGFFLVFVPSFGEFVIPGLIGGDKYMFVGTVITQYILGNRTLSLGAAFTVLSSSALIIFAIISYILIIKIFKKPQRI